MKSILYVWILSQKSKLFLMHLRSDCKKVREILDFFIKIKDQFTLMKADKSWPERSKIMNKSDNVMRNSVQYNHWKLISQLSELNESVEELKLTAFNSARLKKQPQSNSSEQSWSNVLRPNQLLKSLDWKIVYESGIY